MVEGVPRPLNFEFKTNPQFASMDFLHSFPIIFGTLIPGE
jgi:hypothetical protein